MVESVAWEGAKWKHVNFLTPGPPCPIYRIALTRLAVHYLESRLVWKMVKGKHLLVADSCMTVSMRPTICMLRRC